MMRLAVLIAVAYSFRISTVSAQNSTASAVILYPSGIPIINYLDEVDVSYTTPWTSGANLTLWCYQSPAEAEVSPSEANTAYDQAENPGK